MPTLQWWTRDRDVRAADAVPYRLLAAVPELDGGAAQDRATTPNMLVQGDNLDALKALLPFYAGQVKCIYIDPPYNTRSAFEHYDDNLEHAQWLAMIYPRLVLLRELLAEDGSIWVSIDDNEGHYLKVLMDEVFGRRNFITNVIWRKNYSPKSTARHFSEDHDHIHVYAKNGNVWLPNLMPRGAKQDKAYKNPDHDVRGPWKTSDLSARNFYSKGIYSIETPGGRIIDRPPGGNYWRVSEEKFWDLDRDNRIWWGKDKKAIPQIKRFLSEVKQGVVPQTFWSYEEVGHTQDAKKEVLAFSERDVFITPKPERLINRILHIATNPGDLVLDSFLGSGTTAAVAHKMGRRWIGIEMGDHAVSHCQPRLAKVIAGEQGGISAAVGWQGGGAFRFFRLGEAVFDENGQIRGDIDFAALAAHLWFAECGTPWTREGESGTVLGVDAKGRAIALLYNGILKDRSVSGGNVLTRATLGVIRQDLPPGFDGPMLVYGERCILSPATLEREGVVFRQTPYDVKARA